MEEIIKSAKNIITEISEEVDNKYIKSTLNIVSMKLDTLSNTEMTNKEFNGYRDKIVNYEINNMKHIVPALPDDQIQKLTELGNLILSIEK